MKNSVFPLAGKTGSPEGPAPGITPPGTSAAAASPPPTPPPLPRELDLSPRGRRALEAICDTFAPGDDGLPSASALGVPEALLAAVAANPRAAERKLTARLLELWNSRPLSALAGGRFQRFSELDLAQREKALLSWADSRLGQRRAAFQALRKGVLLMYYMLPGAHGERSPVWDAIGYPGPLGPPETKPPRSIEPFTVDGDVTLECDVCVVGSGAGGGTAAGVLAQAGLDVIVLEAGGYYDTADFDGAELQGFQRLYLNGGGAATADQSLGLIAGACLGGGTTVNFTTSFRTPDDVREEWASLGASAFSSDDYTRSLDAVCERLGVNQEHNRPSARDDAFQRGLARLGWHADRMPRNVRGCEQGRICGYCGQGCQNGAKQSTLVTWLADAHATGTRVLVNTRAERVVVGGGRAEGVEAVTADGHRVSVRSRAVVSACGAINTPALLRRSGLGNRNIGKYLRLHPVSGVWGVFDEEIRPWEGTMQAIYSDEHRHLDGGYGVKYETGPIHPSLIISFAPWRSAAQHARVMEALPQTGVVGVILRDRDSGEVKVARDGQPVVKYSLSPYDTAHMRIGIDGAAQILEAAEARQIFSSHSRWVSYEPGRRGNREQFMRDADACGWSAGRCVLNSFHIMGSARMGGTPADSACDPDGQTWDVRDLYVCDGSAFPTASGVNPMISIEAIAHMNAVRLASKLGGAAQPSAVA
jgi:choline dehydrogenase-like flavoprotein